MEKITDVAAAVIERADGSFLLGRRSLHTHYPNYWEFPGGKVEAGESAHEAVIRELAEELGIQVIRADPWLRREHKYEHAYVRLHFFRVRQWQGELRDHVHSALAWQHPAATTVQPMLPANAPVLAALTLPSVYGITCAANMGTNTQLVLLRRALESGLRLVQLREPELDVCRRAEFAHACVGLCRQYGARILINADVELARETGADGIHLPAHVLRGSKARPNFPLVAASCHDAVELSLAAALGCDFAVCGPVLPTTSHPEVVGLGWHGLAAMLQVPPLPVYALGGLSSADLENAYQSGAHGVASRSQIWGCL